jgi:hypothetical protein
MLPATQRLAADFPLSDAISLIRRTDDYRLLFDSASIPGLMPDLNDLLFGDASGA